jgi:hypothetical protein
MTLTRTLGAALLATALLAAGCAKKEQSPVERAVEGTKDALNVRDNEKLKDAAEDVKSAVTEAKEGVKDAVDGKK